MFKICDIKIELKLKNIKQQSYCKIIKLLFI